MNGNLFEYFGYRDASFVRMFGRERMGYQCAELGLLEEFETIDQGMGP